VVLMRLPVSIFGCEAIPSSAGPGRAQLLTCRTNKSGACDDTLLWLYQALCEAGKGACQKRGCTPKGSPYATGDEGRGQSERDLRESHNVRRLSDLHCIGANKGESGRPGSHTKPALTATHPTVPSQRGQTALSPSTRVHWQAQAASCRAAAGSSQIDGGQPQHKT
jgi:hypothetical protein